MSNWCQRSKYLAGIVEKLDYLSDLGVGSVWVSPMYPSPQKDNGYDVKDFTDIDPVFGDLNDFDELVAGLHERGLKLFMDFIPNHSSDQHEWFQKSVKKEEPYTNYYVWSKNKPNNWVCLLQCTMCPYQSVISIW